MLTRRLRAGRPEASEIHSSAADPFAHCDSHPALTPGPPFPQSVSRTEATTVPRLQPEEFASPLQSGLRYGIMSHISAQPGFSPGSSQQVCRPTMAPWDLLIIWKFPKALVSPGNSRRLAFLLAGPRHQGACAVQLVLRDQSWAKAVLLYGGSVQAAF